MRHVFLVTYDICDDRRLRQVYKIMRNWGDHLQYSVFECQLSEMEQHKLYSELRAVIHQDEDQVLFVDLGPVAGRGERVIRSLGKPYVAMDSGCVIV